MNIKSIAVETQKFYPENSFALISSNVCQWELTFLQMLAKLKTLRESTTFSVYSPVNIPSTATTSLLEIDVSFRQNGMPPQFFSLLFISLSLSLSLFLT